MEKKDKNENGNTQIYLLEGIQFEDFTELIP